MSVVELQNELKNYYWNSRYEIWKENPWLKSLFRRLDHIAETRKGVSAVELKAVQYEIIAEEFTPVLFRHSPFYSEMGVKAAEYDGVPGLGAGGWLFLRNRELFRKKNPLALEQYYAGGRHGIQLSYGPYIDYDHHCFPYTNVMEHGLEFFYRLAAEEKKKTPVAEELLFLDSAMRGLLAVRRIAEKFAAAAETEVKNAAPGENCDFLKRIASVAAEVPWRKPETFYEGLCCIWFLHEVCASIEGIGMSVVGHLDRLLGPLYRRDREAGRLTSEEAYDLICRFLVYIDCKYDSYRPVDQSFNRQEQGDVLVLGGCDSEGKSICNEVTFLILKAHHELKLIYPKIHCRISRNSPPEFLDAANRDFLSGRNVIAFLNDDALIPAQILAGKSPADARRYVAGGCWEVIDEGFEHSAGANNYFNLARVMDLSIHDSESVERETGDHFRRIDGARTFEEVYGIVMDNVLRTIRRRCQMIRENGCVWEQVSPAPFFSACLSDCLKAHRDYTAGGGRYNPHGLPLASFAVFVDSLLSIRTLCFEKRWCSLSVLLDAVRADWNRAENLRQMALSAPRFGDDSEAANALAGRILKDLFNGTRDLKNERGGAFQLGLYNYVDIVDWASKTSATPDGRRKGDFLTQGLTPSRRAGGMSLTTVFRSCSSLDLSKFPANSLLTVSLARNGIDSAILRALEYSFAESGIGMLQLNCIDRSQLEDARIHPENHTDLIVRLYGYSARFVTLTAKMQEEFLSRPVY